MPLHLSRLLRPLPCAALAALALTTASASAETLTLDMADPRNGAGFPTEAPAHELDARQGHELRHHRARHRLHLAREDLAGRRSGWARHLRRG